MIGHKIFIQCSGQRISQIKRLKKVTHLYIVQSGPPLCPLFKEDNHKMGCLDYQHPQCFTSKQLQLNMAIAFPLMQFSQGNQKATVSVNCSPAWTNDVKQLQSLHDMYPVWCPAPLTSEVTDEWLRNNTTSYSETCCSVIPGKLASSVCDSQIRSITSMTAKTW